MDEQIQKALTQIESTINNLSNEYKNNQVSNRAYEDELKRLGEEQLKTAQALAELAQKSENVDGEQTQGQSVGDRVVANDLFKSFSSHGGAINFNVSTKAAATSLAGNTVTRNTIAAPLNVNGIVRTVGDMELTIEDLIPHVPTTSPVINYLAEGTFTNGAKGRAEGAAYAESTFTQPSLKSANVVDIGHFARVTQELVNDAPAFAAYINYKMMYGLNLKVEEQILSGDASATQLNGIMHSGNYVDKKDDIKGLLTKDSNLIDFVLAAKAIFNKVSNYEASHLVMSSEDWTKLQMLKDTSGKYLIGNPQGQVTKNLWGVPVVTSSAKALKGKYILMNGNLGATIYERESVNITLATQDSDNFTKNLITLKCARPLALAIENPNVFLAGDFTLPTFP